MKTTIEFDETNFETDVTKHRPCGNSLAAAGIALWGAFIVALGAAGMFDTAGSLPLPILGGVAAPILLFLALFRLVNGFRDFVLSADPLLVSGLQAWRFAGFGFLALYAHGLLPALFAWPAGLGDMAIGITAPWIVRMLARRPAFAATKGFVLWQVLGLLDFVVALGTGVLGSGAVGIVEATTTAPMGRLPLVLIPCFLVPFFTMLHLTAIFQARRLARATDLGLEAIRSQV